MSTAAETKQACNGHGIKGNHMLHKILRYGCHIAPPYALHIGKSKLDPDIEAINNELMPYWDSFNEASKLSTLTLTSPWN